LGKEKRKISLRKSASLGEHAGAGQIKKATGCKKRNNTGRRRKEFSYKNNGGSCSSGGGGEVS